MPPQYLLHSRLARDEDDEETSTTQKTPQPCTTLEEMLHHAVQFGDQEEVADLLAQGVNVNSYENGMTPLAHALHRGRGDMALFLLKECTLNLNDHVIYFNVPDSVHKLRDISQCQVPHLLLAVAAGLEEVVRKLLEKGVDPNAAETPSQRSALHIAAEENFVNITQILIEFEANINKFDADGNTPLHTAVSRGHDEIAMSLTAAGANVNIQGANGVLPLRIAIQKGNVALTEDLLEHGALVHAYNAMGRYMLHSAVQKGSLDLVKALLKRGAYGSAQDVKGETPLSLACELRRGDLVEAIMESDNNSRTSQLTTPYMGPKVPIHIAALRGYTEIIEIMLKHGALVNQRDTYHRFTALLWAVRQGHTQTVLYLLQNGANPNMPEPVKGLSPLHLAAKMDFNGSHLEIFKILVQHGADVQNCAEPSMKTALHVACEKGAKQVFQYLLKCPDVPLNTQDKSGNTALTLAINNHHVDLANELVLSGCDITAASSGGETPFHNCIRAGHYGLALAIIHSGCEVKTLDHCGQSPLSELVHQVVERDLDSNERNDKVFHLLESMLFLGADIGCLSDSKSLISHLILRKRSDRIMRLALEVVNRPPSLLQSCALKIRRFMMLNNKDGASTESKMHLLPLPNIVKQQLTQNWNFPS